MATRTQLPEKRKQVPLLSKWVNESGFQRKSYRRLGEMLNKVISAHQVVLMSNRLRRKELLKERD